MMAGLIGALAAAPQVLLHWATAAPWKVVALLIALAIAVFLWLWIAQLRQENAEFRAERTRLHHEIGLHRQLLEDRQRAISALLAAETAAAQRRKAANAARKEVRDAPEAEDGALAPVLRRALERLR
ncbi:MAG: hypothetical protein AAGM38_15290 [Pseudomonadota bacterium]